MEKIGEKIKNRRIELKMSQTELANKLDLSSGAVSKWEQGKGSPDISIIGKLAKILQVTTDYLIYDSNVENRFGFEYSPTCEDKLQFSTSSSQTNNQIIFYEDKDDNDRVVRQALINMFPHIYIDLKFKKDNTVYKKDVIGVSLPITEDELLKFILSDIRLLGIVIVIDSNDVRRKLYNIMAKAVKNYEGTFDPEDLLETEIME